MKFPIFNSDINKRRFARLNDYIKAVRVDSCESLSKQKAHSSRFRDKFRIVSQFFHRHKYHFFGGLTASAAALELGSGKWSTRGAGPRRGSVLV